MYLNYLVADRGAEIANLFVDYFATTYSKANNDISNQNDNYLMDSS